MAYRKFTTTLNDPYKNKSKKETQYMFQLIQTNPNGTTQLATFTNFDIAIDVMISYMKYKQIPKELLSIIPYEPYGNN